MLYRLTGTDLRNKQEALLSMAKEAFEKGKRVYIIVPEQATALYERLVLTSCGPKCSLLMEVTCFSRLPNLVLRSYGELCRKSITEEEKKLLLAHVVKENKELFSHLPISESPDGIAALLEEVEELSRAGVTGKTVEDLSASPEKEELSLRLTQLLLAGRLLRDAMGEQMSDPSMEEERLGQILAQYDFFRDSVVLLDLFWDFTAPQEVILGHILSTADTLAVSFLYEKGGASLFSRALRSARSILRRARERGVQVRDLDFPSEGETSLDLLRQSLAGNGKISDTLPQGLRLVECADREEEGIFLADAILEKVHKGARWQDFAILSRSGEDLPFLSLFLEDAGIPFFCERKKPLSSSPLARTLLAGVKMALGLGRDTTLREYLTYGTFELEEKSRFALEKYVATWNLFPSACLKNEPFYKNPEGYQKFTPRAKEELELINGAREKVFAPLRHLSSDLSFGTVEEKVAALVAFLSRIGAEHLLNDRMEAFKAKGDWEGAEEAVQEWNTTLSRLSALARALGREKAEGKEFYSLLTLALSGTLPGTLPQGQDRVQLGAIDFMRPLQAKHVFLVGMNTGVFPAQAPQGRFLSQREREILSQMGLSLSDHASFADDEAFLFFLATLFAKESLTLSFPSDGGSMSLFAKEVQRVFPLMEVEAFGKDTTPPRWAEGAFRYLISHAGEDSPFTRALSAYFEKKDDFSHRQLLALSGKAFLQKTPSLHNTLPYAGRDIAMTYSRLEKYATCRYAYFARYLLEAQEDRPADIAANIKGTFVHRVLEAVLEKLVREGRSLPELSDKELKEENSAACRLALSEICEGEISPDAAYLVRRLEKSTLLILKNLREEFATSGFRPLFFEKSLEELGGYSVPLQDGTKLCLYGSIDRVDLYRSEDGCDWVRVVDYKTGGHAFRLADVANGLSMQMLLYLFALWGRELEEGSSPALPAGVLYLNGMDETVSCATKEALSKVSSDPFCTLSREGLLVSEEEILRAADPEKTGRFIPLKKENLVTLEEMGRLKKKAEGDFARLANEIKSGRIEPDPLCKKEMDGCDFCPFLPLCKREKKDRRLYRKKVEREEIFGKEEAK